MDTGALHDAPFEMWNVPNWLDLLSESGWHFPGRNAGEALVGVADAVNHLRREGMSPDQIGEAFLRVRMRTMIPRLNPDGTVTVPMRAEGPNGEVGDGVGTLSPGDAGFDAWYAYLTKDRR